MAKAQKDTNMVRINVILPESEREAFDKWCRYGATHKVSMNLRIRQLLKADAAGKINLSRTAEPAGRG
jgi:hypothetical protein